MDHAEAVLQGIEPPTVEDFIEWTEEEAVRMGMIGFREEYANLEEIFASFPMNSRTEGNFEDFVDLENCATIEMMGIHNEIEKMKRRMAIMKADRPLFARAERQVDKELLAAGKSPEDIKKYPSNEGRLRMKVMDLYNLKHPVTPATGPSSSIDASLKLGKRLDRQVSVRLPVEAALAEVCKLLDGTCASEDYLTEGWHKSPAEKRIWKYCLRATGQKLLGSPDWTRLLTDADYQRLIQQIQKKKGDKYLQRAILTPVSRLYKRPDVLLNHTLGCASGNKPYSRNKRPQE